jgi:hypothetical protein
MRWMWLPFLCLMLYKNFECISLAIPTLSLLPIGQRQSYRRTPRGKDSLGAQLSFRGSEFGGFSRVFATLSADNKHAEIEWRRGRDSNPR